MFSFQMNMIENEKLQNHRTGEKSLHDCGLSSRRQPQRRALGPVGLEGQTPKTLGQLGETGAHLPTQQETRGCSCTYDQIFVLTAFQEVTKLTTYFISPFILST